MSNQKQPFGIDVSKWQGKIDFAKLAKATPKVEFMAMRLGISFAYIDEQFYASMKGSGGLGLNRIIYHVPYFHVDAKQQVDHIMSTLEKTDFDPRYDRIAVDAEQNNGMTKSGVTQKTAQILDLLKKQINRYPLVYSRGNWVDTWLYVDQLPKVEWWLAHYLTANPTGFTPEKTTPPYLPKGVGTWLIHQTGEKNDGKKYGMESTYLDSNRWNGTLEEMKAYFGRGEVAPKPEPEPPVIIEPLFRAKVITIPPNRLKVRRTPNGIERPQSDWLSSGDIVGVYEVQGDWWRVGIARWCSAQWLERITEPDPEPPVIPEPEEPEPEPVIPDGLLDVPQYAQTDPLWASDIIGASNFNVGAKGCLLTITAAGLTFFGFECNPMAYNCLASARGGYLITEENGKKYANMYWQFPDVLTKGQIVRDEYQTFASGTGWESSANSILSKGKPVWCEVRLNNYQHWVLILGIVNGAYWILDPINGEVKPMDYPQVFRTVSYSKRGA